MAINGNFPPEYAKIAFSLKKFRYPYYTHRITKTGRPKTLEEECIYSEGWKSSLMITFLKREAKRALLESTGIHSSITLISSIRCRGEESSKAKGRDREREREKRPVYILVDGGRVRVWSGIACVFSEVFNPRAGSVSVALARQICDLANGPRRLKRASRHNFLD